MPTSILIVSPDADPLGAFSAALAAKPTVTVQHATTGQAALALMRPAAPNLVVIDSRLDDYKDAQLVRGMLMINAMTSFVILSDEPEDRFHERTEGLGILLQLPIAAGPEQAERLWERYGQLQ